MDDLRGLVLTLHEGQNLVFGADGKEFMRIEIMQKKVEVREGKWMAMARVRIAAPRWIEITREWGDRIDVEQLIGEPDRPAVAGPVPREPGLGAAVRKRRDRAHPPRGPR